MIAQFVTSISNIVKIVNETSISLEELALQSCPADYDLCAHVICLASVQQLVVVSIAMPSCIFLHLLAFVVSVVVYII